jgi:hypothetical protein
MSSGFLRVKAGRDFQHLFDGSGVHHSKTCTGKETRL